MSRYEPTLHTRREFLKRSVGLAAVSWTVPAWLDRTANAADKTGDRILVVVQLSGGNDGLNTVVPYSNDTYHRARPQLRVKADEVLKLNDEIGLNPRLAALKSLYDEGRVAVIQGVGYPNPNRSHFRSMEIWHTASDSDRFEKYGWIGRYFDNECKGDATPEVGVAIGSEAPQAFSNAGSRGISFTNPEAYKWNPGMHRDETLMQAEQQAFKKLNATTTTAPGPLDFLTRTAMNAQVSSDRIREITRSYRSPGNYPNGDASSLRLVAGMIAGGLGARVYYCQLGGFDTHSGQVGRHPNLLQQWGDTVAAFYKDLKAQGNADRVMIVTFSEFGRRMAENASGGTDHGVAAPMFVIGGGVKAGVYGKHPSLTDLDQGDLKSHTDFRRVYATVLDGWLRADSEKVLGRKYEKLAFV